MLHIKTFLMETFMRRSTLFLLPSVVFLYGLSARSDIGMSLACSALVGAMMLEALLWKRGRDSVRGAIAARRARRQQG